MVASWELMEANQVLVGILHTDNTTMAWSFGLRNLIIPGREELRMFDPFMPVAGLPFDHGRNSIAQAAMNVGAKWCFMLDSDIVPPRDAIIRLMAHGQPFISGLYCRRSPPHAVPVMIRNGIGWVTDFVPGSTIEVDLVGAGCLLIHRSVFENLPPQRPQAGKTYFDWRVDCQGLMPPEDCLSEDFTLCKHAKKHGYKILVDTSVICKHVGLAEATFGRFEPCHVAVRT